jgi:hypothetical protein
MPSVDEAAPARSKRPGSRSEPDERDADGHVDEQTPAPRDPLRQYTAKDEAEAGSPARDRAVPGDGARALDSLTERDREERQRGRRGDRGTDALDRPSGQQPRWRLGEPRDQERDREERDTRHEDPAAAEDVAGSRAEKQQPSKGQGIGVLNPGEPRGREVERAVDVGERGDDHRDVDDDHQITGEDDPQNHGSVRCGHGGALSCRTEKR